MTRLKSHDFQIQFTDLRVFCFIIWCRVCNSQSSFTSNILCYMGSCFSCHSMLFQNTILKVLRHNLQEQLVKDATGCLTASVKERRGKERGRKKREREKERLGSPVGPAGRRGPRPAARAPAGPAFGCWEQVCTAHSASPVVHIPCWQSPRMPRSYQHRVTSTRGEYKLLTPRFAPSAPQSPAQSRNKFCSSPPSLSPETHFPPGTMTANSPAEQTHRTRLPKHFSPELAPRPAPPLLQLQLLPDQTSLLWQDLKNTAHKWSELQQHNVHTGGKA